MLDLSLVANEVVEEIRSKKEEGIMFKLIFRRPMIMLIGIS